VVQDFLMSATVSVEYRGRDIWVRDVSLSILVHEMLAAARARDTDNPPWLAGVLDDLRVSGIVGGDFCLDLDFGLDDPQRAALVALIEAAIHRLQRRSEITAAEAAQMELQPGDPVIWRGEDRVCTTAIVELGGALIALMGGTLPPAPTGTWWAIGWDGGWQTIRMGQAPPE
jgi:hypothetical protein